MKLSTRIPPVAFLHYRSASLTEAQKMTIRNKVFSRASITAVAASAIVLLAGCVEAPPPRRVYAPPPPDKPNTDVYAYPQNNQTPDQQERDRYECNNWAVKQSGFDPSAPNVPPHDRYRVVAAGPPPGSGTAVGAITGAILGVGTTRGVRSVRWIWGASSVNLPRSRPPWFILALRRCCHREPMR